MEKKGDLSDFEHGIDIYEFFRNYLFGIFMNPALGFTDNGLKK